MALKDLFSNEDVLAPNHTLFYRADYSSGTKGEIWSIQQHNLIEKCFNIIRMTVELDENGVWQVTESHSRLNTGVAYIYAENMMKDYIVYVKDPQLLLESEERIA